MSRPVEAFVGGYAAPEDPGIHVFALDESAGELHEVGAHRGVTNPSFVLPHPDGLHLYAVQETGGSVPGAVHAFGIEREPGRVGLAPLGHRSSEGDHPCHLALHPSGRWLSVSNYSSGNVVVFPVGAEGSLGERTAAVQHEGRGPHPARQEGPHAHSSVFSPDGRFLVVADLGIDRLAVYRFDAGVGALARHAMVPTAPGSDPRHMVFDSDGRHLYVVGELDNSLTRYEWDDGEIRMDAGVSTLPPDAEETTSADIHLFGGRVYVSNRGHDSVAVFSVDGNLRRTAVHSSGGAWPRGFAVSPSGRHLLVANRHTDEIVLLPLLAEGGDIGPAVARARVPEPACVAFGRALDD